MRQVEESGECAYMPVRILKRGLARDRHAGDQTAEEMSRHRAPLALVLPMRRAHFHVTEAE